MPFLPGVLERNLRQLLKMFLHAAVVDEATTPYKLIKLDLQKKDSFLLYDSVKLPTATGIHLASSKTIPKQSSKSFAKSC